MSQPRTHIIGAGLAGLSAAVTLAEAGHVVSLHESGPAAGGRCRSYFDRALGCRVDNGNHLLLSGNRAAIAYLERIGQGLPSYGALTVDDLIGLPDVEKAEFRCRAPGKIRIERQ